MRPAIASCLIAVLVMALSASDSSVPISNGPGIDAQPVEVVRSPLLPRKTRHIIKFQRWGLA